MDYCFEEKGEGRPLLFLHGYLSNKESFYFQTQSLCQNFKTVAIDLAGFGVNSILSEKWNSSAAYAAYGGYNVSSWFKQNSDIIGSGCGGGTWQTSDLLYWKCYKMPDYSDNYPRIYRIDKLFSNFSSVQNGLVIELKWNPKDPILPEDSV